MPHTYMAATGPGAVGRTDRLEVSCRRSSPSDGGSLGTYGGGQDCMAVTLPSGAGRVRALADRAQDQAPGQDQNGGQGMAGQPETGSG